MIDSKYRTLYQKTLVAPILKTTLLQKINPSSITLTALFCGMATLPLLWANMTYLALALLALSGWLDTLDGSLARAQNSTSSKGAVLDIFSDRIVEISVIVGLYLVDPIGRALETIVMLSCILLCITSFLVVGIFSQNSSEKSFHYSPGLIERSEAFLFFALMILMPGSYVIWAWLFSGLVLYTAVHRVMEFLLQENF